MTTSSPSVVASCRVDTTTGTSSPIGVITVSATHYAAATRASTCLLFDPLNVLAQDVAAATAPLRVLEFDPEPVAALREHPQGRALGKGSQRRPRLLGPNVDRCGGNRERCRAHGRRHRAGCARWCVD